MFILMKRDENGAPIGLQVVAENAKVAKIGAEHKFRFAGSGDYHFFETIAFEVTRASSSINAFENALFTIIARGAISFRQEIEDGTPLHYRYGGGFEIATFFALTDRFEKVPYATYFWWNPTDTNEVELKAVFSNSYDDRGNLHMNRYLVDSGGILDKAHYEVSAPFQPPKNGEPSPPDLLEQHIQIHHCVKEGSPDQQIVIRKGTPQSFQANVQGKRFRCVGFECLKKDLLAV